MGLGAVAEPGLGRRGGAVAEPGLWRAGTWLEKGCDAGDGTARLLGSSIGRLGLVV